MQNQNKRFQLNTVPQRIGETVVQVAWSKVFFHALMVKANVWFGGGGVWRRDGGFISWRRRSPQKERKKRTGDYFRICKHFPIPTGSLINQRNISWSACVTDSFLRFPLPPVIAPVPEVWCRWWKGEICEKPAEQADGPPRHVEMPAAGNCSSWNVN